MRTAYKRADRVADQIRMEVADILMRKTKDPRLRSVTVTDVLLSNDLRLARIYVTTIAGEEGEREVFAGLTRANGFIRTELGRRLTIRHIPELLFVKDVSGPRGDRVLRLLESLHVEPEVEPGPPETNSATHTIDPADAS
ncbi:MAG TPA: 30S ribosome-binding factor RbfA [Nitrospiraceae bacterium]|jgi:ribosome-binding factor A|nr:30S ribosome-binding factor RbfA [Nitrospiraceae bacterium]